VLAATENGPWHATSEIIILLSIGRVCGIWSCFRRSAFVNFFLLTEFYEMTNGSMIAVTGGSDHAVFVAFRPTALEGCPNLSPKDFKTVHRKNGFFGGDRSKV
jgi:hypothetical protein